jgi:hypothetical protein
VAIPRFRQISHPRFRRLRTGRLSIPGAMPNYTTDQTTRRATPAAKKHGVRAPRRKIKPAELIAWLEARIPRLKERWAREIRSRGLGKAPVDGGPVDEFVSLLTSCLPLILGPLREQVEPIWISAAEKYGQFAASRGLAAGEVIEEFQILREFVIRDLYRDPPLGGRVPLSLREVLRLNRAIDRGVTHASVGHTNAMFHEMFDQGEGESSQPADGVAPSEDLVLLRRELEPLLVGVVAARSQ